jgi:hypothetical protein
VIDEIVPAQPPAGTPLAVRIFYGPACHVTASLLAVSEVDPYAPSVWVMGDYRPDGLTTIRDDARGIVAMLTSCGFSWQDVDHWIGVCSGPVTSSARKSNAALREAMMHEVGASAEDFPYIATPYRYCGSRVWDFWWVECADVAKDPRAKTPTPGPASTSESAHPVGECATRGCSHAEPPPAQEGDRVLPGESVLSGAAMGPERASSEPGWKTIAPGVHVREALDVTDKPQDDYNEPGMPFVAHEHYRIEDGASGHGDRRGVRRVAFGLTRREARLQGEYCRRKWPCLAEVPLEDQTGLTDGERRRRARASAAAAREEEYTAIADLVKPNPGETVRDAVARLARDADRNAAARVSLAELRDILQPMTSTGETLIGCARRLVSDREKLCGEVAAMVRDRPDDVETRYRHTAALNQIAADLGLNPDPLSSLPLLVVEKFMDLAGKEAEARGRLDRVESQLRAENASGARARAVIAEVGDILEVDESETLQDAARRVVDERNKARATIEEQAREAFRQDVIGDHPRKQPPTVEEALRVLKRAAVDMGIDFSVTGR